MIPLLLFLLLKMIKAAINGVRTRTESPASARIRPGKRSHFASPAKRVGHPPLLNGEQPLAQNACAFIDHSRPILTAIGIADDADRAHDGCRAAGKHLAALAARQLPQQLCDRHRSLDYLPA